MCLFVCVCVCVSERECMRACACTYSFLCARVYVFVCVCVCGGWGYEYPGVDADTLIFVLAQASNTHCASGQVLAYASYCQQVSLFSSRIHPSLFPVSVHACMTIISLSLLQYMFIYIYM